MKLSHIRDVLAAAELGSLRQAGRRLNIGQPTITRSIREVERELGAPVFERHAKGVKLTQVGEVFVRRAAIIETELRRVREEIEQIKGFSTGQVSVAASIASSIALLPAAMAAFRKRYPDALVQTSETLFQPVEQDLIDGRVDIYFGALETVDAPSRLIIETLFTNQRVAVCRKGHKLADSRNVADLATARWVRPALSSRATEASFVDWLESLGITQPLIVQHTRSALQTALAVTTSDLLTVVPRQWLELPALNSSLEVLKCVEPLESAPICLVRPSEVPLTPMAEHFCDMIRRASALYVRRTAAELKPLGRKP